ncbi:NINE protein [Halobaculum sp. WSA2]|uniref:NINE protein n=2 Tax=Halobaculum saliterrae TaxID=2073113 RepID=A0A6B0SWF1_9EURY|nr:NINE protein [Halobaculum saliterrae]
MDERLPDDLAIAVVNRTGSRTTANVGCRAGGDVLFVDRVTLAPGERREWSESAAGTVEVAVQVKDGPEAAERFDPGDGAGGVSATIAAGSISFSTDGGREATGGAGGGGVDSFAAAETGDDAFGGDDGDWGFGGDSTEGGDAWSFDDGTDDADATDTVDTVDTGGDAAHSSTSSADDGWGFGDDDTDSDDGSHTNSAATATTATGGTEQPDVTDEGASETGGASAVDRSRSGNHPDADSGARRGDGDSDGDPDPTDESGGSEPRDEDTGPGNPPPEAVETAVSTGATDGTGGAGRDPSTTAGADERYCTACGAVVKKQAELCPECGVRQSNAAASGSKDRTSAALLAIFLGWLGAHHFYLGNTGRGIVYLLLSWTLIPYFAALIEALIYLTKSDEEFQRKYGT